MMPLQFCSHLARSIRDGNKTLTFKPAVSNRGYNPGDIVPILEPWGYVLDSENKKTVVFESSFVSANQLAEREEPRGYTRSLGGSLKSERSIRVISCEKVRISSITESQAKLAGMIPTPGIANCLEEFKRQWNKSYKNKYAFDSDPIVYRIEFSLVD